jgi:hypothetical protein
MNNPHGNAQEQVDQWDETLRCPSCELTGIVSLSQDDSGIELTILWMPQGFKVVGTEFGPTFYCEACNILVDP